MSLKTTKTSSAQIERLVAREVGEHLFGLLPLAH